MKHIVRHIEYLIQGHDCVVLPGIGAIEAHGKAAEYDYATSTWAAPSRVFTFNPSLTASNHLLEESVARYDRVSLAEAEATVNSVCAEMSAVLADTGVLDLGLAGRLTLRNGVTAYEPGVSSVAPMQMWLPNIHVEPIATAAGIAHEAEAERQRRAGIMRVALRRAGQAAACIAVILAIGWVAMQNINERSGEQVASVAPTSARSLVELPGNNDATFVLVINRHDDASVEVEPRPEAPKPAVPAPTEIRMNDADSYCLVVASLSSLEEAQKYVRQHTDINLRILTIDGRFRVYAATGRSAAEALQATHNPKIASRYGNAWACPR